MSEEVKDLSADVEEADKQFDELYKEYKEVKHKYSKMGNGIDKADIVEAHSKITNAVKNITDYISDLFRDLYSCSECEEERTELKKAVKNLAMEYKII